MNGAKLFLLMLTLMPSMPMAQDALVAEGEAIYAKWCGHCHGPQGRATQILEERYQGAKPALVGERTDLTEEFIAVFIRTWIPGMSVFRPTEISDGEIPALAAYLNRDKD